MPFSIRDQGNELIEELKARVAESDQMGYEFLMIQSENPAMVIALTQNAHAIIKEFSGSPLFEKVNLLFNEVLIERRQDFFFA